MSDPFTLGWTWAHGKEITAWERAQGLIHPSPQAMQAATAGGHMKVIEILLANILSVDDVPGIDGGGGGPEGHIRSKHFEVTMVRTPKGGPQSLCLPKAPQCRFSVSCPEGQGAVHLPRPCRFCPQAGRGGWSRSTHSQAPPIQADHVPRFILGTPVLPMEGDDDWGLGSHARG